MRVYELAKELDLSSKDILAKGESEGWDLKSHMSTLTDAQQKFFIDFFDRQRSSGLTPEVAQEIENSRSLPQVKSNKGSSDEESSSVLKEDEVLSQEKKGHRKNKKTGEVLSNVMPEVTLDVASVDSVDSLFEPEVEVVEISFPIPLREFCRLLDLKPNQVISVLIREGKFIPSLDFVLTVDHIGFLKTDFSFVPRGFSLVEVDKSIVIDEGRKKKKKKKKASQKEQKDTSKFRPPVVTIMGHVDHGKTSLLDYVRSAKVVEGESGGITQHIGAYSVETSNGPVVFIDTPGHEAFTHMRARGAQVTDIVVIVIAADDGIMMQTKEAIEHAQSAGVPIVVAINKIDKPNADVDKVYSQLSEMDLTPEQWGGKVVTVSVSAHTGEGVDDLLEYLALESELLELESDRSCPCHGVVLEAHVCKGQGVLVTLLVQEGVVSQGQVIWTKSGSGRIRQIQNDQGHRIKEAYPGYPIQVMGFDVVPESGEQFYYASSEKEAKKKRQCFIEETQEVVVEEKKAFTLEDLYEGEDKRVFTVFLKADNYGTLEAVRDALENFSFEQIEVKVVKSGVGMISESDVMLAKVMKSSLLAFHIDTPSRIQKFIENEGLQLLSYDIIYDLLDGVKEILSDLIGYVEKEVYVGRAVLKQVFHVSSQGSVVGCLVEDGMFERNCIVVLKRGAEELHRFHLRSLKRVKDDVKEVKEGFECGMLVAKYKDCQEGDTLEAFRVEREKLELDSVN